MEIIKSNFFQVWMEIFQRGPLTKKPNQTQAHWVVPHGLWSSYRRSRSIKCCSSPPLQNVNNIICAVVFNDRSPIMCIITHKFSCDTIRWVFNERSQYAQRERTWSSHRIPAKRSIVFQRLLDNEYIRNIFVTEQLGLLAISDDYTNDSVRGSSAIERQSTKMLLLSLIDRRCYDRVLHNNWYSQSVLLAVPTRSLDTHNTRLYSSSIKLYRCIIIIYTSFINEENSFARVSRPPSLDFVSPMFRALTCGCGA